MEWQRKYVFISSTFNDMHAERDFLVKEVFPELTEWCEEHKIRLTDIDLRWGVTEEDSQNSKTIETCLRHIDKSRPFFLCFLGQRRGWVPNFEDDINAETKGRYTDIEDLDGRSATEMEIEHALLKPIHLFLKEDESHHDCPATKHSLFFFRDDSYLDDITYHQKLIYTNESEEDEEKIKLADEELAETKNKIRARKKFEDEKPDDDETKVNVLITEYKGHWDKNLTLPELNPFTDKNGPHYTNGENQGRLTNFESDGKSLKEVIISQLKEQLAIAFPENMVIEPQNELERDIDQQEIFCYLNSEGFIPRPTYTKKLEDYVENDYGNKICLVTAEAGYGKTMLLAKFATDFKEKYEDTRLYKRFCGASDLSSSSLKLWQSILGEAGISEDEEFYPHNHDELKRNISDILEAIAEKGKSLIIIDAVNQMSDGVNMLKWLGDVPDNLKIISSVKKDESDEKFSRDLAKIKDKRNYCGFEIKELNDNDKKDLINDYLKNYLKSLDDAQVNTICEFEGSKNPLFLKILLAELRVFGSFDQLKDEIQKFGDSPISAFNHVLERLEHDEDHAQGAKIVSLLFSLLANARNGLSEKEIVSIIEANTDFSTDEIKNAVRLNLRQVRPFMARKEGRNDFFYESFKLAAQERYGGDSNKLIADYFLKDALGSGSDDYQFKGDDPRSYNELPYHLNESRDFERLKNVLSSYSFIKNKLEYSDINNLIADYQFKDFEDGTKHEFLEGEDDHPIVLIGRALELSAPILDDNRDELPVQLYGRLVDLKDDEIIKPIIDEIENTSDMFLKPKSNSLYSPKSPIIKRPKVNGTKSVSAIHITEDKLLVVSNSDGTLNLFDLENNDLDVPEYSPSPSGIIKIIPTDEGKNMLIASQDGHINKWDINNRSIFKDDENKYPKIDAEITDIYLSNTYNKIYASSHTGVFTIDLETKELRREDIESKNYNQILVPRRNEAILVCDEREVDGWDVYEMRKAYNKQHQQNDDEDSATKLDSSEEIRFMGLNKRFLTLISENGQMKFWNTLKNSGGGESIAEERVCSLNDKFKQAKTLEDENEIITISDMGVLRVWDIPNPKSPQFDKIKDIQTGIKSPTSIDYYNDGEDEWVIIGNKNNDVNIIDLNKEIEEDSSERHAESAMSIKIDGNHMITASDNGEIFTWDLDNEKFINKYTNDFRCNAISYNRQESRLLMAGVKTEKDGRKTYKIATCDVTDEMFEAKGDKAIPLEVEEKINSAEVIDIAQNSSGEVLIEENRLIVGGDEIPFDKTATTLAGEFESGDVYVGFEDGSIVKYPDGDAFSEIDSPVNKIKVLNDKVIAGYENGSVAILDSDLNNIIILDAHEKAVTNIYVDEKQLISLSKDNTIKFWDIESKECSYIYYLDIFATSINIKDDKLVMGDALGNLRFFSF
jgi:WD40 repeat protein